MYSELDTILNKILVAYFSYYCQVLSERLNKQLQNVLFLLVLGYQAMEKDGHLHLGEVCSYTKSHTTSKSHEVSWGTICVYSLYDMNITWLWAEIK